MRTFMKAGIVNRFEDHLEAIEFANAATRRLHRLGAGEPIRYRVLPRRYMPGDQLRWVVFTPTGSVPKPGVTIREWWYGR